MVYTSTRLVERFTCWSSEFVGSRDPCCLLVHFNVSLANVSCALSFVCMCVCRCGGKSSEFATKLINDHHVAVAPGDTFGRVSEGYVRISFASSDEDVTEGVTRLCAAIKANANTA